LIVIALLGAITLIAVVVRLTERLAVSTWEPAIAMEAARLNAGLPLYEAGHATHMYGPLLTVLLAEIFRVTGLNLLAGRIGFSIFAFALAFLLSAILCRGSSRKYWFVAFALFLGVNLRTNLIFLSAQPRLHCRGFRRRRSLPLGGAARFIAAFRLRDWVVRLRSPFQANERRICAYPNCLRFNLETRIAESLRFADPSDVDFGDTRDHSFHLATSFSRDDNSPRFDRG